MVFIDDNNRGVALKYVPTSPSQKGISVTYFDLNLNQNEQVMAWAEMDL